MKRGIMKKKVVVALTALTLLAAVLAAVLVVGRVGYVWSLLQEKEQAVKQALAETPDQSNAPDGVERFIRTGTLVFEPAYVLRPSKIDDLELLNMTLSPRVSNGPNDGWVGKRNGGWYVKVH